MKISEMHTETQLVRKIDLAAGNIAELKNELATYLVGTSKSEDIAKETDRLIEKCKKIVDAEYPIEHIKDVRNFWLHIKNLVRVQLAAKHQPDMMVDVKKNGKTHQEPVSQIADKGIKAATNAAASINKALGVSDGRSKQRGTRKNPTPDANNAPKTEPQNIGGAAANWIHSIKKADNGATGPDMVDGMIKSWAFIQHAFRAQGYEITYTKIEKQVQAKPKAFPKVDAVTQAPAKGKKHQPQPLTH